MLQAIFPFILFSGREPLELDLLGGTNVHWSLSYEYFDQVLLPTLEERFGIIVERELRCRGWSLGKASRGHIWLKVHPVAKGQKLTCMPARYEAPEKVTRVDVNVIVPELSHHAVRKELVDGLHVLFPDADVAFKLVEDSRDEARWNILLVAHSAGGVRWGRDVLFSMPKKSRQPRESVIAQQCRGLCKELYDDVSLGGSVDEFLQDQLISVQALAEGYSSFPRGGAPVDSSIAEKLRAGDDVGLRREKTHEPFGHGSGHTKTARWVVSQLLPHAQFYNKGDVVKGVGFSL